MSERRRERLLVSSEWAGERLDRCLTDLLSLSRRQVKQALDRGWVFVDGRVERRAGFPLCGGEELRVTVAAPVAPPPPAEATVLWRDAHLLALAKPAGLLSHPTVAAAASALDTARSILSGEEEPILLHRLDKETSGVLLFASGRESNRKLSRQFSDREVSKTYLALVEGRPPAAFAVDNHLRAGVRGRTVAANSGGARAVTEFATLATGTVLALVEARPLTGRTHQIRCHLAGCGFPLVGDPLYGGRTTVELGGAGVAVSRHMLHAWKLAFRHPDSGAPVCIEAPLPADFAELLARDGIPLPGD